MEQGYAGPVALEGRFLFQGKPNTARTNAELEALGMYGGLPFRRSPPGWV